MPDDKRRGTGEPGWTEEEKNQGAPASDDGGTAGDAVPKAGYGGDARAATEAAAAQTTKDRTGKASPEGGE